MTTDLKWDRKQIRLDPGCYSQYGTICSVTLAVHDRQPVFANPAVAGAAVDILRTHAKKLDVPVYGYCVMPDHIHLVLGTSSSCDIITFIGQFKNLVQRAAWGQGVRGAFWQKRFWDHFLRSEEQVEQAVEYVLNNPIRKALVDRWSDYPFSGSLVFPLRRETGEQGTNPCTTTDGRRAGDKPLHYYRREESRGQAPALLQTGGEQGTTDWVPPTGEYRNRNGVTV